MPWSTPTLRDVRSSVRDSVRGRLPGADASVPNSVLRVLSDAMGALCHLALQYVDWLALQLLPDTAETQWLDRQGKIWLINADGSTGRKTATFAIGTVTVTGTVGKIVPKFSLLTSDLHVQFQTMADVTVGAQPTPVAVQAIDAGAAGNLDPGDTLEFLTVITGVDDTATVVSVLGGTEQEKDDELRARILLRIQQPPMGGDADDYVNWALRVPGVTRAWASNEMGIGTMTIRIMCDDLRVTTAGFPLQSDLDAVTAYLNKVRPVTLKDFFVVAPIPEPIDFALFNLNADDPGTRAQIDASVRAMLLEKAKPAHMVDGEAQPAQTIYAVWVSDAVLDTVGVEYFDINMADHVMPTPGSLAVLGTISYT